MAEDCLLHVNMWLLFILPSQQSCKMVLLSPLPHPILQMGTLRLREEAYMALRSHCCQAQIPVPTIVQLDWHKLKCQSLEQRKAYCKGQLYGQLMLKGELTHDFREQFLKGKFWSKGYQMCRFPDWLVVS